MSDQCQLVFYGEVLPGHEAASAKARLGELLKLSGEPLERVFSGRKVVLRKSLSSEQATRYVERFEQMGLRVFAEPLLAPVVPAVAEATTTAAATVAAGQPAVVEDMECPKCGERQPRRTLCRACSVDMKRYAEAQLEVEREAREERLVAREVARTGGAGVSASGDAVGILGLGFSGRMGRLSYLMGNLLYGAFSTLAVLAMNRMDSLFIAAAIGLLTCIAAVRLSVLRCHDIEWSGWWVLLLFLPYVGLIFFLILLILPGSREDNAYGGTSPMPSFPAGFAITAVFVLSMVVLSKQAGGLMAYAMMAERGFAGSAPGGDGAVVALADADVEIFTTTTCGVCHMAMAYMDKRGISYFEKDVERDEDYLRDFYARGGRGVPYIFVGDQSMMGFDPDWLERALGN